MKHLIEADCQCSSCGGTGVYVGICERDGAAVVCHSCDGTGKGHIRIEYEDFEGRRVNSKIERVFETSSGIVIGTGNGKFKLSDFGGMPYQDWLDNKPFPKESQMRQFSCPRWYAQSTNKDKPDWKECTLVGAFSGCDHYPNKDKCWKRYDKEK